MSRLGDFIGLLRAERLRLGYSQTSVAQALQLTRGTLCNWETGISFPTTAVLRSWADLLDMSVPEGLKGSDPRPNGCGTLAAYQRHHHNREPVDDACREAMREYYREYRRIQRQASPP